MSALIAVFYRTIHKPSGKMFYGVHRTLDLGFGTNMSQDSFIGSGHKLVALYKQDAMQYGAARARQRLVVEQLYIGSYKDCLAQLSKVKFVYDHPLCLNEPPPDAVEAIAAITDVPKTEEHKAAIGAAMTAAVKAGTHKHPLDKVNQKRKSNATARKAKESLAQSSAESPIAQEKNMDERPV